MSVKNRKKGKTSEQKRDQMRKRIGNSGLINRLKNGIFIFIKKQLEDGVDQ